jgi:hypothetical protein
MGFHVTMKTNVSKKMKLVKAESVLRKKLNQKLKNVSGSKNKNQNQNLVIYEEKIPLQYSVNTKQGQPKFGGKGDRVTICHSEYLTDVVTLGVSGSFNGFNCAKFSINAGLKGVFPWLSSVARNFVNYKFKKLAFVYRPMSSTNTPGIIMMVSDPDPAQPLIESKVDFLNRKNATTGTPYKIFSYNPLTEDINKEKSYYVRTGTLPANSDIKLADCCSFFIAYQGTPTASLIGEFHVTYEVELTVPVLYVSRNQIAEVETFFTQSTGQGTISNSYPLGSNFSLSNVIGKFVSTGWNYLKGATANHYFSSNKAVSKVMSLIGNLANFSATGLPGMLVRLLSLTQINKEDPDVTSFVDESVDLLSLADTSPGSFTDVTSTYATTFYTALIPSTGSPANSFKTDTLLSNVPAGTVIQVSGNTASSNNPATFGQVIMTDYNVVGNVQFVYDM